MEDRFTCFFFFFQAEDGIRDADVTGVQTCALPISRRVARYSIVALIVVGFPAACRAQAGQGAAQMGAMDSTDHPPVMAEPDAMGGPGSPEPHMILTAPRAPRAAASWGAAALVRTTPEALARDR